MGIYGEPLNNVMDVVKKLYILDELCVQEDTKLDLLLVGGTGLMLHLELMGRTFRSTRDIDFKLLGSEGDGDVRQLLSRVSAEIVGDVAEVPPIEDMTGNDTKKINYDFKNIQVFIPSIEMLACMKIFSTRLKDWEDLYLFGVLDMCDLDRLVEWVKEYEMYVFNAHSPDLNTREFKELMRIKGYSW